MSLFLVLILVLVLHHYDAKPCVPKKLYSVLIVGQDYDSINNYTAAVNASYNSITRDLYMPFGYMTYTALQSPTGSLTGLKKPINYGSGIEWASGLVELYPNKNLQIGLYLVDSCDDIVNGKLNYEIDYLANYIDDLALHNIHVYLRIGYEFDNPYNNYEPSTYQKAFKHIVIRFRRMGIANVAFVWHSYAQATKLSIDNWYPGDTYVDWCGVSIFEQPYACTVPLKCIMPEVETVLKFCNDRNKPLMIAESTPFGGIVDETDHNNQVNEAGYEGSTWSRWFVAVLALIEKYDIRMFSYINCNWDALPMWQQNHAVGVQWGDTRVEQYPDLFSRWKRQMLLSSRFFWDDGDKCMEEDAKVTDDAQFYYYYDDADIKPTNRSTHPSYSLISFSLSLHSL